MKLTPKQAPIEDILFNRRRLAFYGLVFSIYWVHLILAVYCFALYKAQASDAVIITAFLAVPGSLTGLGFYKYLKAAESEDNAKQVVTNSDGSTSGNVSTITTIVENKPSTDSEQNAESRQSKTD